MVDSVLRNLRQLNQAECAWNEGVEKGQEAITAAAGHWRALGTPSP